MFEPPWTGSQKFIALYSRKFCYFVARTNIAKLFMSADSGQRTHLVITWVVLVLETLIIYFWGVLLCYISGWRTGSDLDADLRPFLVMVNIRTCVFKEGSTLIGWNVIWTEWQLLKSNLDYMLFSENAIWLKWCLDKLSWLKRYLEKIMFWQNVIWLKCYLDFWFKCY